MQHMVNGRTVSLKAEPDGSINSDHLRRAAGVPADRPLILQAPDGSNRIINPGEKVNVEPDQYFTHVPPHKRGFLRVKLGKNLRRVSAITAANL